MSHACSRARLVVKGGPLDGTAWDLDAEETLLGRSPTANISLADEGISREHAMVAWDEAAGAWSIEDLQSTNGTKVNGKRVRSATLSDGDEIQVGRTVLGLELDAD